ncbi:MAG: hypothetical protein KJ970_07955 [Candidatus Eisenbacteria bacterium]|uniref:Uncharacterized protein n=1 Tax=Eiseniibacteriota bacterium TaxID=2212470 RepID=A0A948W687_UNCEI|nr:hypothetical protein [Candidatus Eisenbacteria bacterium]MBU1947457.1 hypothetical protein [Candidatus Eisenbacteria bacterium]MBU2690850.1 hypothetical protein [Candidatus Eisenbacteria bacterium]
MNPSNLFHRFKPIGSEIDRLAGRIANEFPTPLNLPPVVQKIRKALGLPPTGHLILTTNHAAATLSPWNLGRILLGEGLARRLRLLGVDATAVVLPLDHNTLGDINRPGLFYLGGRSWKWPRLPRDSRRVVSTIELQPPDAQWRDRIRQTLLQDIPRQNISGARVAAAMEAVLSAAFDRKEQGRADHVWSRMQKNLLQLCGFEATRVCFMSEVESLLATSAPWPQGSWDDIRRASLGLGDAWAWPDSLFWGLCDPSCTLHGRLQATRKSEKPDAQEFVCRACGRRETLTSQSVAPSIAGGRLHPRVHLLVLWLRRGLAPIIHTAGPQMISYAHAVTALENKLADDPGLPPQWILPVGSTVPAIVLTPLFSKRLGPLQSFGKEGFRGRALWRRVVDEWARSDWTAVEARLGPRLREGGFPPAPKGIGVLEAALREWGWWPPHPSPAAGRESQIPIDPAVDFIDGFMAWAHPFRWAGGWDWLYSGLTAASALQRWASRTLEDLSFPADAKPPRAPRSMIQQVFSPNDPADDSLVQYSHRPEPFLEELLCDPPEEVESSGFPR